eukprot:Sspe_Gene.104004::Locus_79880_Transcript_2_2_Confidence_0.500_Length_1044::g.104004::m.104004/K14165/K14165; atypical dual specificity phosphatase
MDSHLTLSDLNEMKGSELRGCAERLGVDMAGLFEKKDVVRAVWRALQNEEFGELHDEAPQQPDLPSLEPAAQPPQTTLTRLLSQPVEGIQNKEPTEILPGLYLGGWTSGTDPDTLLRCNITHVVNAAAGEAGRVERDGVTVLLLPAEDSPEYPLLDRHLEDVIAFIRTGLGGGGRVLVHCMAGVSRSATLVAAYVMREYGVSWREADYLLSRRRPIVCPNSGFVRQLEALSP